MKTLLVGCTDLTASIANEMVNIGMPPCACVGTTREFRISYSESAVSNARHADMANWAHKKSLPYLGSTDCDDIADFACKHQADFCLVAGWFHMLPRRLRDRFPRGTAGIHASLLPHLRGGAPLNWAILSDLRITGVTLFELGDGVDDGPILAQTVVPLEPRTTIADLVRQAEIASAHLIQTTLPGIATGSVRSRPQQGLPSYGMQRTPEDGRIDWKHSAHYIDRLVRAVGRPYPGAVTSLHGQDINIWAAVPAEGPVVFGAAGQISRLPDHELPGVVTGDGMLMIKEATFVDGDDALSLLRASNNKRFSVVP